MPKPVWREARAISGVFPTRSDGPIYRYCVDRLKPRNLIVPLIAGFVSLVVVGTLLLTDLSLRHEGAELASVGFGLVTLGPWWVAVAWLPFLAGAVLAGWIAKYVSSGSRRTALTLFLAAFWGSATAIATTLVPALWWPSGLASMLAVIVIAVVAGLVAYPRSTR